MSKYMDEVFKALSDKNRRKILEMLKQEDLTVGQIAEHFDISGASISHHLDSLKRARLVIDERQGQFIKYSLNTSVLEEMLKTFMDMFGAKKELE